MSPLRLAADDLSLEVRAEQGGAVTRLDMAGIPILRPTPPDAAAGPAAAAFVLAPYPNRIAFGRFVVDGETITLPPDPDGAPHALHGEAWRAPWAIAAVRERAVELAAAPPRAWPWRIDLRQTLDLRPDGLDVTISLRNADARAMPAGLGWHPAFARRRACRVRLDADAFLATGPDLLPVAPAPLPPHWAFSSGAAGDALAPIDHCLTGWTGRATLTWPDMEVSLAALGCGFLQAYAPARDDFLCLEPQTCAPDAFNRDATFGARRLEPGDTMVLRIRIDVARRG